MPTGFDSRRWGGGPPGDGEDTLCDVEDLDSELLDRSAHWDDGRQQDITKEEHGLSVRIDFMVSNPATRDWIGIFCRGREFFK